MGKTWKKQRHDDEKDPRDYFDAKKNRMSVKRSLRDVVVFEDEEGLAEEEIEKLYSE